MARFTIRQIHQYLDHVGNTPPRQREWRKFREWAGLPSVSGELRVAQAFDFAARRILGMTQAHRLQVAAMDDADARQAVYEIGWGDAVDDSLDTDGGDERLAGNDADRATAWLGWDRAQDVRGRDDYDVLLWRCTRGEAREVCRRCGQDLNLKVCEDVTLMGWTAPGTPVIGSNQPRTVLTVTHEGDCYAVRLSSRRN